MARVPAAARQLVGPLRATIIRYPALPLAAAALLTFIWLAADNGGYDPTTWYPGALIVLALFAIAALTLPLAQVPRPVAVAVVALLGYAAWSYLSIGWAGQKGDAWDGANRSLLYALSFALFALWRPRARPAVALLVAYCLGVAVLGLVELLRATSAADPRDFFNQGRFASPAGYMNANVALWFTAFYPCVAMGARRELAPLLRGLLVAGAVLLGGLAVLGQSRGWLFIAPVATLVFVALQPRRVRTVLTLGLVFAAVAVALPVLLDVYKAAGERGYSDAISSAVRALIVSALVAGVATMLIAVVDGRVKQTREGSRRAGRALGILFSIVAIVGVVTFVSVEGSPFHVASKAWREFKTQPSPFGGESRFTGSLGTHRYDFWRVSWDRFAARPLAGIGADNFQADYLRLRESDEAPRYPHSVELRTLSQTGLIGAGLLLVGIGAALVAAAGAVRQRPELGGAVAAAATMGFGYWLLHGSVDWFWEFPALGAPAFALLGLAAGLLPRRVGEPAGTGRGGSRGGGWRVALPAAVAVASIVAALSLAAPWLAELQTRSAVRVWTSDPAGAFDDLDSAASLNPLSPAPKQFAGSIAQRLGQRQRAERLFREAIDRDARDAYAHLELGMLLAGRGAQREAAAVLTRAHRLDPRDDITRDVLRRVRAGRKVDIAAVNRELAARSARLGKR